MRESRAQAVKSHEMGEESPQMDLQIAQFIFKLVRKMAAVGKNGRDEY
jgi:hypothetical protein